MDIMAYERERQNNALLESLRTKVNALHEVTVDIRNSAQDHSLIENTSNVFANLGSGLRGSIGRVRVMGASGTKLSTLKLAGIIVGSVIGLWWIWGWMAGGPA
ncbi:hypothetical protein BZA77DRAFT_319682 [Pyronema omphalodes]|nr:hypothetical protein BZA77DRAFT_319682 [Pyronema omphalodes]